MSQQWIWMSVAAGTLALGTAHAQVDPNSAGAITTSQPNPGAAPGTPDPINSVSASPTTQLIGNVTGANSGTGGSGTSTGAVIPQPYSAQPFVSGTSPESLPLSPGNTTTVTGTGTVVAPGSATTVTGTGAVLAPGTSTTVAGSTGSTATTGALLPPATTTPGTTLPGASISTVTPGTPTGTMSSTGAVLPPATGLTPPGITSSQPTTPSPGGNPLTPDSNTSSNSVTPLGGGSVLQPPSP
ncbi:hypothetical protein [Corallococcus exiguus]|uniref:Uncharacterized protein n=1 Tax=Corallococcus exiguus TaxID=83462 RepID=A0A7X4Y488_9BACT|nr:hypothetical protein [Corallococcus exiguus]NBC38483.1 hypothetical protein [Corallococcus exiguus]TNV66254.1 hypothetical protein FH620_07135 [Corallococcus exiguus]